MAGSPTKATKRSGTAPPKLTTSTKNVVPALLCISLRPTEWRRRRRLGAMLGLVLFLRWGRGAVGSAPRWHRGGRGFESHRLHQIKYYSQSAMSLSIIPSGMAMHDFRARIRMRAQRRIRFAGTFLALLFLSWPAFPQDTIHYSRIRDAKWYARQLQSLREDVAKIDADIRSLVEARKSGKGITDAVALDQEPEGVTSEGQMEVLIKGRILLVRQIDELEEQARHNAIVPGELRTEYGPEEPETTGGRKLNREARELENALTQEQEHLEHARKDAELLLRDQKLKAQQEYSNPESPSRRNKPSDLSGMTTRLTEKHAEVQEEEQKVAELEDRLKDLIQNSPAEREPEAAAESESTNLENDRDEKTEAYWRKQFAALDYQIKTAQAELDILQREHNLGLVQYYPNPATAMKESVTRKEINEHRKAIADKKKELADLKKQRDDLEDALRHAGGPAGWARE